MAVVPAEFTGLARVFRQAVVARDHAVQSALASITAPLVERYRRKPTIRKEMLQDFLRAWSERVSDHYTLDEDVTITRDTLVVRTLRVIAGKGKADGWEQPEWQDGISLAHVTVSARSREVRLSVEPYAHLLQHAVARRIERGQGRDATAVLRDLKTMGDALTTDAVAVPAEIECEGGRWIGDVKIVCHGDRKRRLYEAKTFLN
jgi:hypothetical protein